MTGGSDEEGVNVSAKTFLMPVATGKYQKQPLPDLNVARYYHSSLGLAEQVFVACGIGENGIYLNSLEMLRLGE